MSTPKATLGSCDSENTVECQNPPNYLKESRSEDRLSEAPSELSIVLELPPGSSNILFDASQMREFKTTLSWERGKATIRGKGVRRKTNKQQLDRCKGGAISKEPSVSSEFIFTDYENLKPDASSKQVEFSSKSGLTGSQQGSHNIKSPDENSPSASNPIEKTLKSIGNTIQKSFSRNLTQDADSISQDSSVISVLYVENTEKGTSGMPDVVGIDTTPKIVADAPSDSIVATSKQLNVVEKTSETSAPRSPDSNYVDQSSTGLLKENSSNHSTDSQRKFIDKSSHSSKECQVRFDQLSSELHTEIAQKSSTSRYDNESEAETPDMDDISVTSSKRDTFMRNVEEGQEGSVLCLAREPSVEVACVDLCSGSGHRQKRRRRVAHKTIPSSDDARRNLLPNHAEKGSEMISGQNAVVAEDTSKNLLPIATEKCQTALETEESKTMTATRNRNAVTQLIPDSENDVSTGTAQTQEIPQSTKSKSYKSSLLLKENKKSHKSSMENDITDDEPKKDKNTKKFRKALYKCFKSCGHNFNRALTETLQRTVLENRNHLKELEKNIARDLGLDSEPPSRTISTISHAFTFEIDSNTSCYTRGSLPTSSEATDNECVPDDSEIYRLVNVDNQHRKKKSTLYSETQSGAFVPEDQNLGAGPSTAVTPATTGGDGARIRRRMDIDRSVRIGNTSMNYFVPWDADGFVPEEHIYNSTGIGVQERGRETPDSQSSDRAKKSHQRRRRISQGFEDKDTDSGSVSGTVSTTDSVKSYGGVACAKESVIQEEFISRNSSLINKSRSGEIKDSFGNLPRSQSLEAEENSSTKGIPDVEKSSTALLTLFSKDEISINARQSSTDINEDRSVTLLFSNSRERTANKSFSYGLLTNTSFDAPKTPSDTSNVDSAPRRDLCASDETNVKKKRLRLTKRALRSLEKHAEDSSDSEECFTIDKFDGSSSTIVLRKKRKVPSVGLAFLKLRRTLPCRNLPRLMLEQESKESLLMTDTSDKNLITDVSLEDIKDYSVGSRKYISSKAKNFKAKWVKSADNLIDFAYIAPKITRLGIDEETFLKKGAELARQIQKNATDVGSNGQVDKRQAGFVATNRTIGKRASAIARHRTHHSVQRKSKLETFRTLRRQKYNVIKVDASSIFPTVDSRSSHYSADRYMNSNIFAKYCTETRANIKEPTGTTANEGKDAEESQVKGIGSPQLGCVTPKTSENSKLPKIERSCNQNTARTAFIRKQLSERDAASTSDSFVKKIESPKKAIRKQEGTENLKMKRDCVSSKKEMSTRNTRAVEANCIIGSSAGRGTEAEPSGTKAGGVAGNLVDFVRKIAKGNKRKEVVFADESNDVDSSPNNVNKNTRTDERKDSNSASDCVERVSFEDAYKSILAKTDTVGELSDDGWVTEEECVVSDLESPSYSIERKDKVLFSNSKYQNVRNILDRCMANMIKPTNTVLCSEKQTNKIQIGAYVPVNIAKISMNQDEFHRGVKIQPLDAQKSIFLGANSVATTSCSESRGSESKYPTPLCSKRSSKYRSDAANPVVTTSIIPVESAIRNANPSEVMNENIKPVDSLRRSRSPAKIFKSVQKPSKAVENRNAVAATPISVETQPCSENATTKEEKAKKKMDARRRAAEYDKEWRMRQLKDALSKSASGSSGKEKLASTGRVGYLNTGQVIIKTTR